MVSLTCLRLHIQSSHAFVDPLIRADCMAYTCSNMTRNIWEIQRWSVPCNWKTDWQRSSSDNYCWVSSHTAKYSLILFDSLSRMEPSKIPCKPVRLFFLWFRFKRNGFFLFVFTGANYIIETTSVFTTIRKCQRHIQAGARKVIIAGQSADAPMLIMGVNEENYTRQETILSTGSCTTTCLAPFVKVVHDKFDIVEGSVTKVSSSNSKYHQSSVKWLKVTLSIKSVLSPLDSICFIVAFNDAHSWSQHTIYWSALYDGVYFTITIRSISTFLNATSLMDGK